MDKQQAAREAFEKAWQRSIDSYTGDPDANTYGCSHQEAGWLMWQAALSQPSVGVEELIKHLCVTTNVFTNDIEEITQAILSRYNVTERNPK